MSAKELLDVIRDRSDTRFFSREARDLGTRSAVAYRDEFGETPTPLRVGDWDSSAWTLAWQELQESDAKDIHYAACLSAWRHGFFGSIDLGADPQLAEDPRDRPRDR